MNSIIIRDATEQDKSDIVKLSQKWEAEKITYGYTADTYEALNKCLIWSALHHNNVIGYLMGQRRISEGMCVIPKDKIIFYIVDFYITPEFRNREIGKILFEYVEQALKCNNVDYILLSTATKGHVKIQKFYTEKLGMKVWTTTLFKNISD